MFFALIGLIPGVLNALLASYQKRADTELAKYTTGVSADTQIILAQITADIEARKLAAATRAADRGSLWTAWMFPCAFGLCMIYFGAVVLDSIPFLGHVIGSWRIAELPAEWMIEVVKTIILASAGIVGINSVARRIFK
jgi:hypothetical protein